MKDNRPYVVFNKEYLKEAIPIEEVISRYTQQDVSTRKNIRCPNPNHVDKTPSAKIYTNTNLCNCAVCGNFDVFNILQMYNPGMSFTEICYLASEQFNIPLEACSDYNQREHAAKERKPYFCENFPLSYKDMEILGLDPAEKEIKKEDHDVTDYVNRMRKNINQTTYHRGLSDATLQYFNVGFDPHWVNPLSPHDPANGSPRLIIPTSDHSYQARLTYQLKDKNQNARAKCRKVGSTELFNAEALNANRPVFIVEGEIDAMSYHDIGCAAIAVGGVGNVHSLLARFAKDRPQQPFIIAMDNDERGNEAKFKLIEGFDKLRISYVVAQVAYPYKDANEALMDNRAKFMEMAKSSEAYAARFKIKERLIPENVKTILDDIEAPKPEETPKQTETSLRTDWYAGNTEVKMNIEDFILEKTDMIIEQYQSLYDESTKTFKELRDKYTPEEWKENRVLYKEYNKTVQEKPAELHFLSADALERVKDSAAMEWTIKIGKTASERLAVFSEIKEKLTSYQDARNKFIKRYGNPEKYNHTK